jgi:hypothetical protein
VAFRTDADHSIEKCADTGTEMVLDCPESALGASTVISMDYRDEAQVGEYTYGVSAKTEPAGDGELASVAVEFTGADMDGRIVAEGNLLIALEGLADAGSFLLRTLDGLAALHGQRAPRRSAARSRSRPPNAGQPWTEEHGERLRERWMQSPATTGHELLGELAEEFGRTRGAVRAQLPRLGCDPDVPGRPLAAEP